MQYAQGITEQNKRPPVVKGLPLLGSALALRQQGLLPLLRSAQRSLGDVFCLRIGLNDNYVVAHPDHAAYILQQNAKNYAKSRSYKRLRFMLGEGLLITEGDTWRRQRSIAQPFFSRQRISPMATMMSKLIDARLTGWGSRVRRGEAVDVKYECRVLSLELISHSVFGLNATQDSFALGKATDALSDYVERQRWNLLRLPSSLPTPRNLLARYHRWCVDRVARRFISSEYEHDTGGLISMLLQARNDQGEPVFNEAQIRDQIVTILVAGYETTAAALGWTMFLLARHKEVQEKLRAEVDAVLGRRLPTGEELNQLPYLTMVLQESMRLYPPAWVIGRRSIQADSLGDYAIPADAGIGIYPFLIHRHPQFFSRPDDFDPENFAPAIVGARPRCAYFPFGAGTRSCIGNHLAMLELKLCVAMFVQRFRISVPADYEPRLQPFITLSPPDGMPLRLHRAEA
jgi:cytochrome P450